MSATSQKTPKMRLRDIFLFLFMLNRFTKRAVQYDQQRIEKHKKDYGGVVSEADPQELAQNNMKQAKRLRASFVRSLGHVFLALVLAVIFGFVSARLSNTSPQWCLVVLQLLGAFVLLAATLWQIRWEESSMTKDWLVERVHDFLFKSFYFIGTWFIGWAIFWGSFYKLCAS